MAARLTPFTCPECGATFGDMPLDGSYLKIGNAIIIRDLEMTCSQCQCVTTWRKRGPRRRPPEWLVDKSAA